MVELLIGHGADIDAKGDRGSTPLFGAACRGDMDVAELLINGGADIDFTDERGWPPLHGAALQGHADMVEFLLDEGAGVDVTGGSGQAALHWAAFGGHASVANVLLEHDAGVDAADDTGQTALDLAVSQGHSDVVSLLRDYGAGGLEEEAGCGDYPLVPGRLALVGSDLAPGLGEHLASRGWTVTPVTDDTEILIVGQELSETDCRVLRDLVGVRAGGRVRAYSEDMFRQWEQSGTDPFEADREEVLSWSENHAGLKYLVGLWFEWPTTFVFIGSGRLDHGDWPRTGVRKACGYHVGKKSTLSEDRRHEILRHIYLGNIPYVCSEEHMREWGMPSTGTRLHKLANALASQCCNDYRRMARWGHDCAMAVEHYETDLEWLQTEFYYTEGCSFDWPSTRTM